VGVAEEGGRRVGQGPPSPLHSRRGQGQAGAVQGAGPCGHKDLGFLPAIAAAD
jgi:hypothetical protein